MSGDLAGLLVVAVEQAVAAPYGTARLADAGIASGRMSSLADLAAHPQRRDVALATPGGPITILAPPVLGEAAVKALGPVPALGEHDALIRREFGGD